MNNSSAGESRDLRAMQERLESVELQSQLARLDLAWQQESKGYEFAYMGIPGPGVAVLVGAISIVMAIFFVAATIASSGALPGVLCGLVLGVFGLAISALMHYNARQFEKARQDYERRRAEIQRTEEFLM
jgi:hypothetical protein